jgi:peptidoglycan L-alanyl-D-glutamate endopeptidase CwlK
MKKYMIVPYQEPKISLHEEQNKLYEQGRTVSGKIVTNCDGYNKKSKHNFSPSKACDIVVYVGGAITWDPKYYKIVASHILQCAKKLKINITWGGSWKNFPDYPHFQID